MEEGTDGRHCLLAQESGKGFCICGKKLSAHSSSHVALHLLWLSNCASSNLPSGSNLGCGQRFSHKDIHCRLILQNSCTLWIPCLICSFICACIPVCLCICVSIYHLPAIIYQSSIYHLSIIYLSIYHLSVIYLSIYLSISIIYPSIYHLPSVIYLSSINQSIYAETGHKILAVIFSACFDHMWLFGSRMLPFICWKFVILIHPQCN
jgi:hypothetical protein